MADDLKKAFLDAAEIANKVPKHLQEIAFNRALDALLGNAGSSQAVVKEQPHRPRATSNGEEAEFTALLNAIDRTQHPDVAATSRVADRALKVLELANNTHKLDGLSAPQIADILTKRFRLPVSINAINMALEREVNTVNIGRAPNGVKVFHLMAPGEEYLRQLRAGNKPTRERKAAAPVRQRKHTSDKSQSPSDDKQQPATARGENRKKHANRPGPKASVEALIGKGYFSTARVITEIREELKHNRGHAYSVQELAPALVRLLRDQKLTRTRNEAGQYEYSAG